MWVGVENGQVSAIYFLPCDIEHLGQGLLLLEGGRQQTRLLEKNHMDSTRATGFPVFISPGQLTSFLDHIRLVGQGGRSNQVKVIFQKIITPTKISESITFI